MQIANSQFFFHFLFSVVHQGNDNHDNWTGDFCPNHWTTVPSQLWGTPFTEEFTRATASERSITWRKLSGRIRWISRVGRISSFFFRHFPSIHRKFLKAKVDSSSTTVGQFAGAAKKTLYWTTIFWDDLLGRVFWWPQVRRVEVRVLRVLRFRMCSFAPKSSDLEVFQKKKAKLGVDMMLICKLKPGPEACHLAFISGNCFCEVAMTVLWQCFCKSLHWDVEICWDRADWAGEPHGSDGCVVESARCGHGWGLMVWITCGKDIAESVLSPWPFPKHGRTWQGSTRLVENLSLGAFFSEVAVISALAFSIFQGCVATAADVSSLLPKAGLSLIWNCRRFASITWWWNTWNLNSIHMNLPVIDVTWLCEEWKMLLILPCRDHGDGHEHCPHACIHTNFEVSFPKGASEWIWFVNPVVGLGLSIRVLLFLICKLLHYIYNYTASYLHYQ